MAAQVPIDQVSESDRLETSPPNESEGFWTLFRNSIQTFAKFVGPGLLVSIAYIDPGNYSTDVSAGASTQYAHLFIVLFANVIAVYFQLLAVKLGAVTGLDLAQNCRLHCPRWLNIILYIMAEAAIVATDIAEVGNSHAPILTVLIIDRSLGPR